MYNKDMEVMNMETIDIITTLISNLGFPIACCAVLFWQNNKLRDSLDKNTNAIEALAKYIDRGGKK